MATSHWKPCYETQARSNSLSGNGPIPTMIDEEPSMPTMLNVHDLLPCQLCSVRMAVPGTPICTMCDAVSLPAMIPDDAAALSGAARD